MPGLPHSLLRDPRVYRGVLEAIELPEEQYFSIVCCLESAFPSEWVHREVERVRDEAQTTRIQRGEFTLRPYHWDFFDHNPLPEMLAGQVVCPDLVLCELIGLGQDLRDIAHLDRVSELIESLKRFRLYDGALFEVEVLAEFVRADLHPEKLPSDKPGPDFKFRVGSRFFFVEVSRMQMSDIGRAALQLMRNINQSETLEKLAFGGFFHVRVEQSDLDFPGILSALKRLAGKTGEEEVTYQGRGFSLRADRGPAEGGYSVTWWEDVRNRVARALRRKAHQSCKGARNIIVLDLRGAIQPYYSWIPGDRQTNVSENVSEAFDACVHFLEGDGRAAAVVLWLPKTLTRARSQSQAYRAAFEPDYRVLVNRPAAGGRNDLRSALRFCILPEDLPPEVHSLDRCSS